MYRIIHDARGCLLLQSYISIYSGKAWRQSMQHYTVRLENHGRVSRLDVLDYVLILHVTILHKSTATDDELATTKQSTTNTDRIVKGSYHMVYTKDKRYLQTKAEKSMMCVHVHVWKLTILHGKITSGHLSTYNKSSFGNTVHSINYAHTLR